MEELYNTYRNEVETACRAFFLWKGINYLASNDREILRGLNESPYSWNTINFSLQNTFFILLGRLFDTDGDSFSVHSFLRGCIENIDKFSKESLRVRKIKNSSGDRSWLNDYIDSAYVPSEQDFHKLRGAITKYKKIYEDIYRPIRNKVIAHKDSETINLQDELFKKTNIGQIEEILNILFQVKEVVFQLLHNGELRQVGDFNFNEESYMISDAKKLLNLIRVQSPIEQ